MDRPQRGDAVAYVDDSGAVKPAKVVEMWPRSWMANLILDDGTEIHGVHRDDDGKRPRTWHRA